MIRRGKKGKVCAEKRGELDMMAPGVSQNVRKGRAYILGGRHAKRVMYGGKKGRW